jgi:hypothetical protein
MARKKKIDGSDACRPALWIICGMPPDIVAIPSGSTCQFEQTGFADPENGDPLARHPARL